MTIVSWVNLTESERKSAGSESESVNNGGFTSPSPVLKSTSQNTAKGPAPQQDFPEFAYFQDRHSGKRVYYKRIGDEQAVLLECVYQDNRRFGMAFLLASNIVLFAIGYLVPVQVIQL